MYLCAVYRPEGLESRHSPVIAHYRWRLPAASGCVPENRACTLQAESLPLFSRYSLFFFFFSPLLFPSSRRRPITALAVSLRVQAPTFNVCLTIRKLWFFFFFYLHARTRCLSSPLLFTLFFHEFILKMTMPNFVIAYTRFFLWCGISPACAWLFIKTIRANKLISPRVYIIMNITKKIFLTMPEINWDFTLKNSEFKMEVGYNIVERICRRHDVIYSAKDRRKYRRRNIRKARRKYIDIYTYTCAGKVYLVKQLSRLETWRKTENRMRV